MIKFSHIGQLHQVVQTVLARRKDGLDIGKVSYRATVKLHGSNASVVCTPAGLRPQSRNRALTVEDDNLGFAAWALAPERVEAIRALEAELRSGIDLGDDRPLVLFGEWIGPGIQRKVAVSQLPERQWVLFALATRDDGAERKRWFSLPALGERFAELGVHSIADGPSWALDLDFGHRGSLELSADAIEDLTARVEARCPWAARFGVEGVGEGLVWAPQGEHFGDSELVFKSKGEAHQITRRDKGERKAAALDPALVASVEAFVEFAVTEARLEQGFDVLREQGLAIEMRSLGPYLQWIGNDVRRECAGELERSQLGWKQVSRKVSATAKAYFRKRLVRLDV